RDAEWKGALRGVDSQLDCFEVVSRVLFMRFFASNLCCVLLVFLVVCPIADAGQTGTAKVILDTDIGNDIDDSSAVPFVISHLAFNSIGITITHGNTPARAKIACKLLHITGRDSIPVCIGRKTNDLVFQQYSWAEDFAANKPRPKKARDFLIETAKRYPGEV